ncbi:hypothetical protein F2981_21305 (plasmid) [Sinorhizobium meliloti]|nr:hypothetical protein [Sinorhizobium meliloti]
MVYDAIGKDTVEASLQCLPAERNACQLRQYLRCARPLDFKIPPEEFALRYPAIDRPLLFDTEQIEKASRLVFEMIRIGVIRADNLSASPQGRG